MAGRGRNATLPAWMLESAHAGVGEGVQKSEAAPVNQGQFDNQIPKVGSNGDTYSASPRERSREKERDHGRERDNKDRNRDVDRDRERDRDRDRDRDNNRRKNDEKGSSSSSSAESSWKPRKKSSNFDIRPPDGVELPPIGSSITAIGIQNQQMVFGHGIPTGTVVAQDGGGALPAHTRHARRIYVGGIPPTSTEGEVAEFFNEVILRGLPSNYFGGGLPVVQVYLNLDKCFAFVELVSIELCNACMRLDGIQYRHKGGVCIVRVRRPNDYRPDLVNTSLGPIPPLNLTALGVVGTTVTDGPGKVFVGGLPYHWTEDQVKELLTALGPLKSFHLVREAGSSNSKGYGFCEYHDLKATEMACQGLNGMQIGDKVLTVRVQDKSGGGGGMMDMGAYGMSGLMGAGAGSMLMGGGGMNPLGMPGQAGGLALGGATATMPQAPVRQPTLPPIASVPPTRVLKLENMVTRDDLLDDNEHADIAIDVREECAQYGAVAEVLVPRGKDGYPVTSEGFVFVRFLDPYVARTAALALFGRKFADRTVGVNFYNEVKFENKAFD